MSQLTQQQPPKIKAVFFDFMGTCLNWHASVSASLPPSLSQSEASKLALEWRRQYFISNSKRLAQNLHPEDIDLTLARTLNQVVNDNPALSAEQKSSFNFTEAPNANVKNMITAWHNQPAWPEVPAAIQSLKDELGLEVFVHANGTTRLQLDLVRFSGLTHHFNMLFSSQLLGVYKPHPDAYRKGLELVKLKPEEVVLVAAHAYDLRGAKDVGMKTVYVHRWTDDVDEDMEVVEGEFDHFLEGSMEGLGEVIRGFM